METGAQDGVTTVVADLFYAGRLRANAKGITPLMAAAHSGALEPLRHLLAAGRRQTFEMATATPP
jgi:hypothetical protein